MMKRRLILINPINQRFYRCRVGLTVNQATKFQPLGLGLLAALTPDNWEIVLVDENFVPFSYHEGDLVGITTFTATASRAYEIAKIYRQKKIPVVMGGFHPSVYPEEALQFAASVVIGEGEDAWTRMLNDFEKGSLQKLYYGRPADLNKLPSPRRDIFSEKYIFASIETSRGCPMGCKFCSVSAFYGKKQRFKSVEKILTELVTVPQKRIFFVDDNIIGYDDFGKERLKDLCRGMIEKGIKKDWWCQTSISFGEDEELLYLASKSGCKLLFIGIEAFDKPALDNINKKLNLKIGTQKLEKILRRINEFGIGVIGAFMFGMDTDTVKKIKERTEYIIRSDLNAIQITYLTPLPGTKLFEEIKGQSRLIYSFFPDDWEHFTFAEVTYHPLHITPQELESARGYVVNRIYSLSATVMRFLKTIWRTKNLLTSLWALVFHLFLRAATIRSYRLASKNPTIQ